MVERDEEGRVTLPVFFVDRTFGRYTVARELRLRGVDAEAHDECGLAQDCDDEVWIEHAGRLGWLALTEDKDVEEKLPLLRVIRRVGLGAFVVRSASLSGSQAARVVVEAIPSIRRFLEDVEPPFVAGLYRHSPRVQLRRRFSNTVLRGRYAEG